MAGVQCQDRILRLRVACGNAADPLLAQLRASAILQGAQLHPPGLPPSAILCVRRMSDPLPGSVPLHGLTPRPPVAWENALRATLGDLAARAAHPARGDDARGAEAVLFQDWAEALACFIRDTLQGVAAEGWWWAGLIGSLPSAGTPSVLKAAQLMIESPFEIPAIVEHLERVGLAGRFIAQVPLAAVQLMQHRLADSFGVTQAILKVEAAILEQSLVRMSAVLGEDALGVTNPAVPVRAMDRVEPWGAFAPGVLQAVVDAPRETVRIVALGLQRAPSVVRSAEFVARVQSWRRELRQGFTRAQERSSVVLERSFKETRVSDDPIRVGVRGEVLDFPSSPAGVEPESAVGTTEPIEEAVNPELPVGNVESAVQIPAETVTVEDTSEPFAVEQLARPITQPLRPIQTRYAGIFYLVNLALSWNFYGDFTRPRDPGLSLPIWDFLALLADRLLAGCAQDETQAGMAVLRSTAIPGCVFWGDPIWKLLATLAGPKEGDFIPPGGFDLDPTLPPPENPPADEWFDWVALCAAKRLREAQVLPAVMLNQSGRVFVTDSRIDVVFQLDEHPLPIRMAGLDRDPGWIPAAGRQVLFHYE